MSVITTHFILHLLWKNTLSFNAVITGSQETIMQVTVLRDTESFMRVTSAIYPHLVEFLHFIIQSKGHPQQKQCYSRLKPTMKHMWPLHEEKFEMISN